MRRPPKTTALQLLTAVAFVSLLAFVAGARPARAAEPEESLTEIAKSEPAAKAEPDADEAAEDKAETRKPRFRVHSEIQPLGFTHVAPQPVASSPLVPAPTAAPEKSNNLGVGLGRLRRVDTAIPLWSVGLGAIVGRHLLVGARTGFRIDRNRLTTTDATTRAFASKLVPYLHYVFEGRPRLNPYAELRFGVTGGRTVTKLRGMMASKSTVGSVGPVVGGGAGMHLGFARGLSLTLGLDLDYLADFTRTSTEAAGMQTRSGWTKVTDVVDLGLVLGISLWL